MHIVLMFGVLYTVNFKKLSSESCYIPLLHIVLQRAKLNDPFRMENEGRWSFLSKFCQVFRKSLFIDPFKKRRDNMKKEHPIHWGFHEVFHKFFMFGDFSKSFDQHHSSLHFEKIWWEVLIEIISFMFIFVYV